MELAQRMPDVDFLVLGEKGEVKDLPQNIKLLGRVYEREKMALYYSLSDATILVSKAETFSMPVAESLCCGTSVVGFKAGGPESIALTEYAKFVEYGKVELLYQSLQIFLTNEWNKEVIADESRNRYAREVMTKGYINVYKQLINDEK